MRDGCHGSRGRYYWEPGQPNIYCSTTTTTTAYPQIRQLTLSNKWAAWWLIVISPQKLEVLIKYFQIHPEVCIFATGQKRPKSLKKSAAGVRGDHGHRWRHRWRFAAGERRWLAWEGRKRRKRWHIPPGEAENHRLKSAFKRGNTLVPREGPLTYFAFERWTKKVEYWGISK